MSKSYKKTPIFGHTHSNSEKQDKRTANKSLRRKVKVEIEADEEILSELREVSNVWSFSKDGKRWQVIDKKYMRK